MIVAQFADEIPHNVHGVSQRTFHQADSGKCWRNTGRRVHGIQVRNLLSRSTCLLFQRPLTGARCSLSVVCYRAAHHSQAVPPPTITEQGSTQLCSAHAYVDFDLISRVTIKVDSVSALA